MTTTLADTPAPAAPAAADAAAPPVSFVYRAVWPILDPSSVDLDAVTTQARLELPAMIAAAGARLTAAGTFTISPGARVRGSRQIAPWVLVFTGPVVRWRPADDPADLPVTESDDPAQTALARAAAGHQRPLSRLSRHRVTTLVDLDADGADVDEACTRLGVNRKALEKWCERHDLADVFERLRNRRPELNGEPWNVRPARPTERDGTAA